MARAKILCMYSGGLDSAGALWQLITSPKYAEYDILVHHVHITNHENRTYAEKEAVDKTLQIFRKYTKQALHYSTTAINFSCLPYPSNLPFDTDVYAFVAANLCCIDTNIKLVATGSTKSDAKETSMQDLDKRRNAVFNAVFVARPFMADCQIIYPVENFTKQEIFEFLPAEIRDLTWSCRRPQYLKGGNGNVIIQKCNACPSCIALAQINLKKN